MGIEFRNKLQYKLRMIAFYEYVEKQIGLNGINYLIELSSNRDELLYSVFKNHFGDFCNIAISAYVDILWSLQKRYSSKHLSIYYSCAIDSFMREKNITSLPLNSQYIYDDVLCYGINVGGETEEIISLFIDDKYLNIEIKEHTPDYPHGLLDLIPAYDLVVDGEVKITTNYGYDMGRMLEYIKKNKLI
jgi:hypothetical protein